MLFSMVAVPVYIPARNLGELPFSKPFPAFILCRLFDDGHSDWCEIGAFIFCFSSVILFSLVSLKLRLFCLSYDVVEKEAIYFLNPYLFQN